MTIPTILDKSWDYLVVFGASLGATLILTPIVREVNRRIGMVDKPDPRRINKVPIPRGGGVAVMLGILVPYLIYHFITGRPVVMGIPDSTFYKMVALGASVSLLGLVDDRIGLRPVVKLGGQLVIAFLTWAWADLGFGDLWPALPEWLNCALTMLWITGAVNAFNLIDGLDGLASGIALIATMGMAGSLFIVNCAQSTLFYFAIMGGLIGFLRYNYNPASVFLGDSGSMFLGFMVASLPFASHNTNSMLVSVGVPLLAMGVPIFDTSLAIIRRSIRHLLRKGESGTAGQVMSADSDHLHHRILRASGLNQRRAAWTLYALSAILVMIGLGSMCLESRAAGLWLGALAFAAVIVFRDMARIELFDAGMLLNRIAHDRNTVKRRRWAKLTIPFFVVFDIFALACACLLCSVILHMQLDRSLARVVMPIRVFSVFACLVFFRAYMTIWSRAVSSNYMRLFLACGFGAVIGSVILYYAPVRLHGRLLLFTILYVCFGYIALVAVRKFRQWIRDLFYAIDCSRLIGRKDVSRVLVYGAGLRYQAFRRELVRTTSANDRIIVGLIDDDILLRGHYIGGIQVKGTLAQMPQIINETNADSVVIACDIDDDWLEIVRKTVAPTGVKITKFSLSEKEI